jgi:hypothetical protein
VIRAVAVAVLCIACGCKGKAAATEGSGSAGSGAPDLTCSEAARKFTQLMAASPGALAELAPDAGVAQFIKITIEATCGTDWTPETRACVKAATAATALPACWKDPAGYAAAQAALAQIVDQIKAKRGNPAP